MNIFKNILIDEESGIACGPCSGSTYVEVEVLNDNNPVFILISRMDEYENVQVSENSMIDTILNADNNFDYESFFNSGIDCYSYEVDDIEDMTSSEYYSAINLARLAMKMAYDGERFNTIISGFIEKYKDVDIDKLDIPEVDESDEYEDEEDYE